MAKAGKNIAKVSRDPAFAKRLADATAVVHPKRHGRQQYILERLAERGISVSSETISKWFKGVARPNKDDKLEPLAQILGVSSGWLLLGKGPQKTVSSTHRADIHPLVISLLNALPEPGAQWEEKMRVDWLQALVTNFRLIYPENSQNSIEVKLSSARQ